MKTLLLFLLIVQSAFAQNVAIAPLLSRPEHEFNAVPGCPTNWPVIVDRLGTNTVSPHAGRTVLTEQALAQLYASVGPAFTNWHTTTWAQYVSTKSAASDARRSALVAEYNGVLASVSRATNSADFTPLALSQIVSNLVRLRQLETDLR